MRIVILGSGIAGCIAARALSQQHEITMIEPMREPPTSALAHHGAVMRIKDLSVALLLGCNAKKIRVYKGVWSGGTLKNTPNVRDNNMYSLKLYGYIAEKSIFRMPADGHEVRYLLSGEIKPPCEVIYDKPKNIIDQTIHFEPINNLQVARYEKYDSCISTLPMYVNCRLAEVDISNTTFNTFPITSIHFKTTKDTTNAYQTIYYPEAKLPLYRASLQDSTIIAESLGQIVEGSCSLKEIADEVERSFGIQIYTQPYKLITQMSGKMAEIGETFRKSIIYTLTTKHNIFSFGRYAIWKPIQIDPLLDDIAFISSLMYSKGNYEILKELGRS